MSVKLFEATSISLSKSATTLFEIPSFYCFVGNPMPKFQLFSMVKPLVLCQKMFCLLIEWGFPLLKNIFPWIYISSLNIYLIFYNLVPWPICECAKKQPMVFSAQACLKIPKNFLAMAGVHYIDYAWSPEVNAASTQLSSPFSLIREKGKGVVCLQH